MPKDYLIKHRRVPVLIRRLPWTLLGFVICVAVFYFVPAFADYLIPAKNDGDLLSAEIIEKIKDIGADISTEENGQQEAKAGTNMYYVPLSSDEYYKAQRIRLSTVKSWQGDEMKEIKYNAHKSPWVLNAGYKVTSKLGSKFDVIIARETELGFGLQVGYGSVFNGVYSYVVEGAGEFLIGIDASGCEWWVRVGVE